MDAGLPPLTAIVVGKGTELPGTGFIAWDADNISSAYEAIFSFNWDSHANPFSRFGPEDTPETLVQRLLNEPSSAQEVYAIVRVRGMAQRIFRSALMKAYGSRCAMCEFSFPEALEAAHIVPWRNATQCERMNLTNGVLLCSLHHRLFDSGCMTITRSLLVSYCDPDCKDGPYSRADLAVTQSLHGRKIHLPSNCALWPNSEFLRRRHVEQHWGDLP
ncbi:HNH endonuclease [Jeongeupia naejangsanensis]|uniref:HNH endonuclease n=2 Tax=Jeongeupia naejangsanensis TaxID=613195 RepID=A0ABS2BF77_9NEIS|nr:HNH endonuclease [Jeongeupia naejangsanensis]